MNKTKRYNRDQFPPGMYIPYGEVMLTYTDHARTRMEERTMGTLNILPQKITISTSNLKKLWTITEEGKEKISSMLVELPYTRGTLLQLIISTKFVVITLHFRETWQKLNARRAVLPALGSIAGNIGKELPSNPPQLDEYGQVVYPKGTYFPKKGWKTTPKMAD